MATPKSRKRVPYLRFSLATMLIALTAGAIWMGYKTNKARRQRAATENVLSLGGQVRFRHQSQIANPTYNHFPSSSLFDLNVAPPGPDWLRRSIGDEYFQQVIYVHLEGKPVTDQVLSTLGAVPQLKYLNLEYSGIEDEGLRHLSTLRSLQCLYLGRNDITDAGLKHLTNLRNLEELEFNSLRRFDGSGLVHLVKLTELRKLSLQYLNIARSEYRHLSKLKGLRELFLSCSSTTDDDLKHVANLENLIQLGIDRTDVTSRGLAHLTGLSNLNHLYVNEEVAVGGIEHLQQMHSLKSISMDPSDEIKNGVKTLQLALPECQINRW